MPDSFELVSSPVSAALRSLDVGDSLSWSRRFPVDQIFDRGDISSWVAATRNRTNVQISRAKQESTVSGRAKNFTFESVQGLNSKGDAILVSLVITRLS